MKYATTIISFSDLSSSSNTAPSSRSSNLCSKKKLHQTAHQSVEPTQTVVLTHHYFDSHVACNGLQVLDGFGGLRRATISVVTSVRPSARNNLAPTRRIFIIFDISGFFFFFFKKIQVLLKSVKHIWYFT
jgi:hypothetical protein